MAEHKCLTVKGITFGHRTWNIPICASVMAADEETLLAEMERVKSLGPDMIEWRYDYMKETASDITELVKKVRSVIPDTVLLVTYRTKFEGGVGDLEEAAYAKLVASFMTADVDFVDVEAARLGGAVLRDAVLYRENDGKAPRLVASFHDFSKTPSDDVMEEILLFMKQAGADICKMAVMPQTESDVERVMKLTERIDDTYGKEMLLMTISMGEMGTKTRIDGGMYGSCFTFAAAVTGGSAPGQIPIQELREKQILAMQEAQSEEGGSHDR